MQVSEIVELLGNSQDAETIALEIVSCETLHDSLDTALSAITTDMYDWGIAESYIHDIVRNLWDIAYSHGYYDGRMEESEGII